MAIRQTTRAVSRSSAQRGTTRRTVGQRPATRRTSRSSGSSGKGSNTWMWWVGGLALSMIISLVIGLRNKSEDDVQVKSEMIAVVRQFPDYSSHADYYERLVTSCHKQAFENAYHMSGRRTSASLDVPRYLTVIAGLMADRAQKEGQTDVAQSLRNFRSLVQER